MTVTDAIAPEIPNPSETEFAREPCVLLSGHEAVISADADMAIIRIKGKGPSAVYVGVTAERALRIGAAFIRAGMQVNPGLKPQLIEMRTQMVEDTAAQLGVALKPGVA